KVEAGKMEFYPEPVDLAKLVDEIRDVLWGVAARKRIRLETTVDPAIGPVVLDSAKLKQVLYNYLSNAVKFTSEDGRVTVRAAPGGRRGRPGLTRLSRQRRPEPPRGAAATILVGVSGPERRGSSAVLHSASCLSSRAPPRLSSSCARVPRRRWRST